MIPTALERLGGEPGFLAIVSELRSRRWLDWHILQALVNYAMNKRLAAEGLDRSGSHDERMSRMRELMDAGDEIDDKPSDLLQPTLRDLEFQGEIQLGVILTGWELEIHQSTPDLPALRRSSTGGTTTSMTTSSTRPSLIRRRNRVARRSLRMMDAESRLTSAWSVKVCAVRGGLHARRRRGASAL
ncbi:MAG: hypothetical protein ACRDM1_15765 [Gaiellaceae bacterium]